MESPGGALPTWGGAAGVRFHLPGEALRECGRWKACEAQHEEDEEEEERGHLTYTKLRRKLQ